jgi:DHA1 family multidrug resistance protein-like MFS transporter
VTAPAALTKPRSPVSSKTSTLIISGACGITSMAFNVWWPFLALYVLELGATSDANALFWVFIGTSTQGAARLITSPLWGMLSDRYGRKMMLLRSLYFSGLTFIVAAVVQEPWQLTFACGLQGVFAGQVGPAAALISVTVPDHELNPSLSKLNAGQYIGTTVGPMLGAGLGFFLGFREVIIIAGILPIIGGLATQFLVPRDAVEPKMNAKGEKTKLEPFKWTFQFGLAVLLYLVLFAINQLVRFVTPVDLKSITHHDNVKSISGVLFSLGGAVSAISVMFVGPSVFKPGRIGPMLGLSFLIVAVALLAMGFAPTVVLFGFGFLLMAFLVSAMVPVTNTLIAANVSRSRRGTAFGIAASAQAVALFIGPGGGALFGAFGYEIGFIVSAIMMLGVGVFLFFTLKEPPTEVQAV